MFTSTDTIISLTVEVASVVLDKPQQADGQKTETTVVDGIIGDVDIN